MLSPLTELYDHVVGSPVRSWYPSGVGADVGANRGGDEAATWVVSSTEATVRMATGGAAKVGADLVALG